MIPRLRRLASFAAAAALVAAAAALFAPAPGAAATRLFIRNHVASNDVRGLAAWQGSLVAATTGGLVTVAMPAGPLAKTIAAPGGLPSNRALCLVVSPSGDLWIGTADAGIARRSPAGRWRRALTTFDGLPSDDVQALLRSGDSVWVGTTGGVALFAETPSNARVALRRSDSRASTAGALVSDDVRALAMVGDTLWAGTGGGLASFASGAWQDRTAVFGGAVDALLAVGDTLWIGTGAGPRAYVHGALAPVEPGYTGGSLALALYGGALYSGSNGLGVYRRTSGAWSPTGSGLPFGSTRALGIAPDGALWAGATAGLARFDPGAVDWTAYQTEGPAVESLQKAAVRDHEAWFTPGNQIAPGLGAGFVIRTDGTSWSVVSNTSTGGALQATSVFGILAAREGDLWLGHCCASGVPRPRVERFDPDANAWVYPGPTNVWSFAQAPDGFVYGAGVELENGVYVFDPSGAVVDSLTPLNTQGSARGSGLSSNNLRAIAFDPAGAAWIATADVGVDRWDGRGTATHADDFWDHYATGFPSPKTLAVVALDTTTAYVGTQAGIVVIAGGRLDRTRMADVNDVIGAVPVQDLVRDPRRVVWIGTTAGLSRYDDAARTMERFTTADGLVDDDVRGLAWDEARGILWVATARGVSEVHPQAAGVPGLSAAAYAYPNPATGADAVRIGGLTGAVTGEIRDLAGNLVRNFRIDPVSSAAWDLRDASGGPAAPGVYLITLRDGSRVQTLRIAVTR
ncbi:MAG TPA: two-component regulator propeller domain-containing protein [Candidatus Omnitrophota bacterium]|nr:two-component regulator propeller domain-containing protein [Candidatus Omnitrophota bacterium]